MTQWIQAFRDGLEARVLSTIADDITTKKKLDDAVKAQKIMYEQYQAELLTFQAAGAAKCGEADQAREAAQGAHSEAKKFRATALDNLEYDLRTHRG